MKFLNLFLTAIAFFTYSTMNSQCLPDDCNPTITGATYQNPCVALNATSTLEISWSMLAIDNSGVAPAGSWYINISFPQTNPTYGISDATVVTEDGLNWFDWTYDDVNKVLRGLSNQAIGINMPGPGNDPPYSADSGVIYVEVTGLDDNGCSNNQQTLVQCFLAPPIPPFPNSCSQAFQNVAGDDFVTPQPSMGVDITLPLSLENFMAFDNNCESISLKWEQNHLNSNANYEIERRIDHGKFIKIGEVSTKDYSRQNDYRFIDHLKLPGDHVIYYRIKQLDSDGNFNYSDKISVHSSCNEIRKVDIYPNPAEDVLNIDLSDYFLFKDDRFSVEILDSNGRSYLKEVFSLDKNMHEFQLKLNRSIAAGTYLCKIVKGDEEISIQQIAIVR